VGELADFLQLRHHSVVGLIDRAEAMELVRREPNPEDRREVHVTLTGDGLRKLRMLESLHRKELSGMRRMDLFRLDGQRPAKESAKSPSARRRR